MSVICSFFRDFTPLLVTVYFPNIISSPKSSRIVSFVCIKYITHDTKTVFSSTGIDVNVNETYQNSVMTYVERFDRGNIVKDNSLRMFL